MYTILLKHSHFFILFDFGFQKTHHHPKSMYTFYISAQKFSTPPKKYLYFLHFSAKKQYTTQKVCILFTFQRKHVVPPTQIIGMKQYKLKRAYILYYQKVQIYQFFGRNNTIDEVQYHFLVISPKVTICPGPKWPN